MLMQLVDGKIYITKGTPMPFLCPNCSAVIPVASLNGEHSGVNRYSMTQKCWACDYIGDTQEFDVEWDFNASN